MINCGKIFSGKAFRRKCLIGAVKMKKLICIILCMAMLPAAVPAFAESRSITFDDIVYVTKGDNLFESPNFGDSSGREAPGWYVGKNTGNSWDGKAPNPVTGENLTPLESVVLSSESEADGREAFYYSSGGAIGATGSDDFLCEYITKADGCYWNGTKSLQTYIPIEGGKSYYFSYCIFTNARNSTLNSSVRFGAINSKDFCQDAANGKIVWSGTGGVNVDEYDGDNVLRNMPWEKHEAVITADYDADYFFFNLYWLQAIQFVCINGFTLMEVEPAEAESFDEVSVSTYISSAPALPKTVGVIFKGGARGSAKADWEDFEAERDGEYTVLGTAHIGKDDYEISANVTVYSDSTDPDYSISKEVSVKDGEIVGRLGVYTDKPDELTAALITYDEAGNLSAVVTDRVLPKEEPEVELHLAAPIYAGFKAKLLLWNSVSLTPLTRAEDEEAGAKEGGEFMPLSDVELLDGMFLDARNTNEDYLMAIDPDRLLAPCFESANLTPKGARYGGWEAQGHAGWASNMGISGHSLGHWMSAVSSACVESARYGDELKSRLEYAVNELARIQDETGSGYIGGLSVKPFEQAFAGTINSGGFNLNGAWVPWYSVHKIYQGLIDAYNIAGIEKALDVAVKFADWAVDGTSNLTDEQMQKMLDTEYGGMNDVFAQLYDITENEKYLKAAVRFTHDVILNPLAQERDELSGMHANTQIPKIVGAAAVYDSDESRTDYKKASEYFWDRVVNHRSFVIGGNSVSEHFEAEGAETLHIKDAETCNTFNMIKLTEHLFRWNHDGKYMDYVENALYNDILGSQDPETGNKMYFTSMFPGHFRIYGTPEDSWWCCTGSGMENPGRYSKVIYYKDADSLYVNLYIPSRVSWKETGLVFQMETEFPYSETVNISAVSGSAHAALKLRVPSWTDGEMTVKVNDEDFSADAENGYISIERDWNEGDTVKLTLPMSLSVYTARDSKNKVAFKYGPIVLASPLGTELSGFDILREDTRVNETGLPSNTVSVPSLKTESENPEDFITPIDLSTLEFEIDGKFTSSSQTLTLKPFYSIHHQFHSVYWYLNAEADPYEKALGDITIDSVIPDGQQDEIGHGLAERNSHQGSFTSGITTYYWRDAYGGEDAYFSYDLKADGESQNYLYVSYWGSDGAFDNGGRHYTRSFDIFVDGEKIASQTINRNSPDAPYNVFYEIPQSVTAGKDKVTVKFAAQSNATCAGGVLNVRITSKGEINLE